MSDAADSAAAMRRAFDRAFAAPAVPPEECEGLLAIRLGSRPFALRVSELTELTEYAMSFVKRNDFDLLDTLLDINQTIFNEYTYRQGSTTVFTTPFEVYANRRGVCQDFTNLFICLARLLGVPARYVCGYIFTGPKNPNQVQSEASHAWCTVPARGRLEGLRPNNGILTQTITCGSRSAAIPRRDADLGTIYVWRRTGDARGRRQMEPAPEGTDQPTQAEIGQGTGTGAGHQKAVRRVL